MEKIYHQEIVQILLGYTMLGAVIFTVIITCLSLIGVVKFSNPQQQKKLFTVLIIELAVAAVAFFTGYISLDTDKPISQIQQQRKIDAVNEFSSASNNYYHLTIDLIRENYLKENESELWEKYSGPEGLDRVKGALRDLEDNFEGEFNDLHYNKWRPAADSLFKLNDYWYNSRGDAIQRTSDQWQKYKQSNPRFLRYIEDYKKIDAEIRDKANELISKDDL